MWLFHHNIVLIMSTSYSNPISIHVFISIPVLVYHSNPISPYILILFLFLFFFFFFFFFSNYIHCCKHDLFSVRHQSGQCSTMLILSLCFDSFVTSVKRYIWKSMLSATNLHKLSITEGCIPKELSGLLLKLRNHFNFCFIQN
jgi:hypothetical protein